MVRRTCISIMIAIISLMLTACWDRKEINDVAFVMSTAFDKEGDHFRTSLLIALPGQLGGNTGGGGGTSGRKPWYIESKVNETGRLTNLEEQEDLSRVLNFSHRRVMLFGEELARSGLEGVMDVAGRIPQNRLSAMVVVSKGPAYKIQGLEAPAERFSSELLREKATSFMRVPRTVKSVVNILLTDGMDLALPVAASIESNTAESNQSVKTIKVSGLGVFSENKLVGFLEGDVSEGVLWAMGQAMRPEVAVEAPEGEGKIVVRFPQLSSKLIPVIRGDDVTFQIYIHAEGSVVENQSEFALTDRHRIDRLEEQLEAAIKRKIEKGVKKLQELNSDAIGFGLTIKNNRPDAWDRLSNDWYSHYKNMKIEVKMFVDVVNIGSVIKPFGRREERLK
jgi:spore germination protein KC